jgi:hypothetical protein
MATITIKIETDELAREVLEHMGYLPEDEVPDLVSDDDDEVYVPPPPKSVKKTYSSHKFID